jgi:hypothetical protein
MDLETGIPTFEHFNERHMGRACWLNLWVEFLRIQPSKLSLAGFH